MIGLSSDEEHEEGDQGQKGEEDHADDRGRGELDATEVDQVGEPL